MRPKRRWSFNIAGLVSNIWALTALAFLTGIVLSLQPHGGLWEIPHAIGDGLIVASLIAVFWHFKEVRDFFLLLAEETLTKDGYLKRLGDASLRQLRTAVASVIVEARVAPGFRYDWKALVRWADDNLFERNLPSGQPSSGVYRERFRLIVTLEFMTLENALAQVGGSDEGIPIPRLQTSILKQTTIASYTALAPRAGDGYEKHVVPLSGELSPISGFPLNQRVQFWVGATEEDATEVAVTVTDRPRGGAVFKAADKSLPFKNGETHVWSKIVEYEQADRDTFFIETMANLTRDLEVFVTAHGRNLQLEGSILASGGPITIEHPANGIVLTHHGWIYEDQGFFVWWWTPDE